MKRLGKGLASGKIILMGEHAVVYGKPAIALPFTQAHVETLVESCEGPSVINSIYYKGLLASAPVVLGGITHLIQFTLKYLKKENRNLSFSISSNLPSQRGLGSSAAVSISIVRALFDFFETELELETLKELVTHAERIHHINPSGLDVQVISLSKPVLFQKDHLVKEIPLNLKAFLVVADTGSMGQTREAVQGVRSLYDANPQSIQMYLDRLETLTQLAQDACAKDSPKVLGEVMNEAQSILKKLGVSNDILDRFMAVALSSKALGAKITGSGKGGCMIALCSTKEDATNVYEALKKAGAKSLWTLDMKEVI